MQTRFSTDRVAEQLLLSLEKDLCVKSLGRESRDFYPVDPSRLKAVLQVDGFLKKYIFEKDALLPEQVLASSLGKFLENQRRLAPLEDTCDIVLLDIIMRARGWLEGVLGDYSSDEHMDLCYFPRKASVGTPMRRATLDERWLRGLTGSRQHIDWFLHKYLPWLGTSAPRASNGTLKVPLTEVDELAATFVPKTWKSLRMIVPNTAIGGLYSNGLGRVLERRLLAAGYDLSVLPDRHKRLARLSSIKRNLATIDQSLASDNITVWTIERLLPKRWTSVLCKGRIGRLRLPDSSTIDTNTMSMMGVGFTFPLQTLVFLSLVHACYDHRYEGANTKPERIISVFGDDVICPVELQDLVTKVFSYFGFQINLDKSFWSGAFKESCGGDYYHGYDVRPAYLPQGGRLNKRSYEAFLYKTFNALRARWDYAEIKATCDLILMLLPRKFVVPPHFGDDTGLKLSLEEASLLGLKTPKRDIHGNFHFPYLSSKGKSKEVKFHDAHYWRHLHVASRPHNCQSGLLDRIDFHCGVSRVGALCFEERLLESQPKAYRSKLNGRRLRKTATHVPIPGDASLFRVCTRGFSHNWEQP